MGGRLVLGAPVGAVLVWAFLRSSGGPQPIKVVQVPTPPAPITVVERLKSGQTIAEVFESYGLTGAENLEAVDAIRDYHSPRRLRVGMEIRLAMRPNETPSRIALTLDPDRTLYLLASEDGDGTWSARLDSVPIVRDTVLVAGLIGSNLYDVRLSGDLEELPYAELDRLTGQLSRIYAWQIDFWRDIRTDDAYRLVMAREVRPDGSVRTATILAAEFKNRDRMLTAVRFQADEDAPVEYYDENGQALRGQFLLAPLDIARVTSGFSMHRFHPVLRRSRPHLGIDYGAPRGTPVRVTGGGVVTRAGPWGSYGTAIEVRHTNNLRTRYAHLSGIARGVRSGVRVEQGQVIGYVGSSGLATAAHLHYEFLRNGSHVNPASMRLPRAEPVAEEDREAFDAARDHALGLLDGVRLPTPVVATSRTQD